MSLKNCKECNHEISNKADKCPNCGAPQGTKKYGCISLLFITFLGLVVLLIIIGVLNPQQTSTTSSPMSRSSTGVENAHYASSSDVRQAKDFLSDLPVGCRNSSASASVDGTVTINLRCSNAEQSLNSIMQIKDGIVTNIK